MEEVAEAILECLPDLRSNIQSAYEQFMEGKITRKYYSGVLDRYESLQEALKKGGYIIDLD